MIYKKLIIAVGLPVLAGTLGSIFNPDSTTFWYSLLEKPALNPPSWIFAPVWTALYVMMGIALYLVWTSGAEEGLKKRALKLFWIQLFLNAIWSPLFFGFQNPGWALADIVLMWLAIVATMSVFYKISKTAFSLLVPYILWVSFAIYLNYSIWSLN